MMMSRVFSSEGSQRIVRGLGEVEGVGVNFNIKIP
jgi:hypothetical protein